MLEAIPLGRCAFALSLLLWNGLAKAQYFIGFQAGPIGMLPLGNSGDQVKHLRGYGIGLAAWDRDTVGQGNFRFGLEWVQRSYNMDLFTSSGGDETHRKLDLRSSFVYFTMDAQLALASGIPFYFDIGPMIGIQVHQRRQGISYHYYRASTDTVVVDESASMFGIHDLRLHLGLSGDIPVGGRVRLMLSAGISPGWGDWAEGVSLFTLDEEFRIGVSLRWPGHHAA